MYPRHDQLSIVKTEQWFTHSRHQLCPAQLPLEFSTAGRSSHFQMKNLFETKRESRSGKEEEWEQHRHQQEL